MPRSAATDVLVIGAGAAGLAAAVDLEAAGFSVVCLEARDRVGGRILTHHDAQRPGAIELGAEFVHGNPPETLEIVRDSRLLLCDVARDSAVHKKGRWIVTDDDPEENIVMEELDRYRGPDQTWAEFVQHARATADAKREATRYVEGFNAAHAGVIGVKSIQEDERAARAIDAGHAHRVVNGYDHVALALHGRLRTETVRLNHPMERLDWEAGAVTALTSQSSQQFSAKCAIITLPLGVLHALTEPDPPVRITPLPEAIVRAAGNIAFGDVCRVTFRFVEAFWERIPGLRDAGFLMTEDDTFLAWWTLAPLRVPILTAWSAGSAADTLAGRGPEEIAQAAIHALSGITGLSAGKLDSLIRSWHFHDWKADPFSRGAYSYARSGHRTARRALAQPVENTLFFAGEATETKGHSATVHGAIATGKRAARAVREVLT